MKFSFILVLLLNIYSCKKTSQTNPYYFTFEYQSSLCTFDSIFANVNSNIITIVAYDTKTKPPIISNTKEQTLQFKLTSGSSSLLGTYVNTQSSQAINHTFFTLFSSATNNNSILSGISLLDTIPSFFITINQITDKTIEGTFTKNNNINDSLIFLKLTNGKFYLPLK